MSNIVSFTVESGDSHYELDYIENSGLAYSDGYVWFYKDGDDYLTLDTALTNAFTGKITGLAWGECVNYKANDDDLKAYGLAEPTAVVKVDYIESSEVATNITDSDGNILAFGLWVNFQRQNEVIVEDEQKQQWNLSIEDSNHLRAMLTGL